MRKLDRRPLDQPTTAALRRLSEAVSRSTTPAGEAARLWKQKSPKTFAPIQRVLGEMATGRGRCMYCEDSAGTDIEHFYPKQRYPERAFRWANYLWACSHCNSNQKRTQFPLLGGKRPALIDPCSVDPAKHLMFLPTTGEYEAIGPRGAKSIEVFALNDAAPPRKLPTARKHAFDKLQILLKEYDAQVRAKQVTEADGIKSIIRDEPFSAVLGSLIAIANGPPAGRRTLGPGIAALVRKHRVETW